MNASEPLMSPRIHHPPGFRPRRGLNWMSLGLMYTSYYLCRYNFPIANLKISQAFGWNEQQMGGIITTTLLAYGFGQIINGLIADMIGGKWSMLIGAIGTVGANIAFGAASFHGTLALFTLIWGINGYLQAFGAPGMVKTNAAWFLPEERGTFAGIFGFMINLGRFGINKFGPMLLAGFTVFGMLSVPALHWRWLFWAPAIVCSIVAVILVIVVKQTPEEAGYTHMKPTASTEDGQSVTVGLLTALRLILSTPAVWFTAGAYACTGAVRQSIDHWFPRYMQSVHAVDLKGPSFQWTAFLIVLVASGGSLISGVISDRFFKSARAPVAAFLYGLETVIILLAAQFHSLQAAMVFFILISLTANATHSLLGTAAAMDIGGRRLSGFASGVIDSFQYFGGSLAGVVLGSIVANGHWGRYFYFMAPFGVIGMIIMLLGRGAMERGAKPRPAQGFDVVHAGAVPPLPMPVAPLSRHHRREE